MIIGQDDMRRTIRKREILDQPRRVDAGGAIFVGEIVGAVWVGRVGPTRRMG